MLIHRVEKRPSARKLPAGLALALFLATSAGAQTSQPASSLPPPVHLTAEQDHQRLMDLLHITSLRRGPSGNPSSPDAANFDESKVPPYRLPDPLRLNNGKEITSAKEWWTERRPEIVDAFDREIYGSVPPNTPSVKWEVVGTAREENAGVPVITKKLVGRVDNSAYPQVTVNIDLTLTTPASATGPVPVIMEFGLSPEILAAIRKRFTEEQWQNFVGKGPTWQQQLLAKGWGYAVLIPTSVQADNGEGLTQGIIGLVNKGQPRKLDDWGALRAWAWGASRALDYFESDKSVDAKHVGIEGLSRYGKAALVTMAYDSRFAVGFIGSSGEGGAKILRRKFGEQVENIAATGEYHWMAGNFLKYAGPLTPNDLPVDAHELIALCAPRPVFISAGSPKVEGGWVDARGMFLAAVGAGPVYRLLGKKDLGATEMPPMETALIGGDLAFRQHSGGHTTGPNWPTFIEFASRYFKSPAESSSSLGDGSSAESSQHEVALTFDDLPAHGPLPGSLTRVDIIDSIIRSLKNAGSPPAYGFVNAKRLQEDPGDGRVLQLWHEAGFPLGNHTFSHMNLNTNSLDAFEQDLIEGEPALEKYADDQDWHWLRYPYLAEGDTPGKHHAIEAFLRQRGYKIAEVTLSFADYAYNEPYARCVAKKDEQAIGWLEQSYLGSASDELARGPELAAKLYGRDIKHVMLLHVGGFQTVMLPKLLSLIRERGYKLIPLPEAESDSVYAHDPELQSNWNGTFLQQMLREKHLQNAGNDAERFARLNAICR